jgi:glycosyltransferase involved in cell wall biosynthesis
MNLEKHKPKVLIFIDWFLPAFKAGGPVQSISNLVNHLGDELNISIVSSDRDLGDDHGYREIQLNAWLARANYRIIYLDAEHQNAKKYQEIYQAETYDYIYFNSFFSPKFTLLPLWESRNLQSKLILAPRGMLGSGALNIKRRKKQFFLVLFRISGFAKRITWHATAESEVKEIKQHFGNQVKVKIAPNLSAKIAANLPTKGKQMGHLKLFFLSRIAEKKNLKAAISYLNQVKEKYHIEFTIIGPIGEPDYWDDCQKMIDNLPENITVNFIGSVPNHQLANYLSGQHFLLLPTFHENFGHVFVESWQNACPVIISDQTPWRNLEDKGIGWDISLADTSKFIEAIEKAASLDQVAYTQMSEAAFDFAKSFIENPAVLEANRKLFNLS